MLSLLELGTIQIGTNLNLEKPHVLFEERG